MSGTTRLPLPPYAEMTPEQQVAADRISAGPRGGVIGPFVPLLHSPELMTRLQLVGEFLRWGSTLPDDLFEVAVLTVAEHWHQDFEWGFHHPIAVEKGVATTTISAIELRSSPRDGTDEAVVWRVVRSLLETGEVDDETFTDARARLGDPALVELVATVGYYTTLALTMNVDGTVPPAGAPRLPHRDLR